MKRVLIADDHEVVRRGLKQILIDEFPRVKIFEATTSREALDQCGFGVCQTLGLVQPVSVGETLRGAGTRRLWNCPRLRAVNQSCHCTHNRTRHDEVPR